MSRQHQNAARTRARRKTMVDLIKSADGQQVNLGCLDARDLLHLRGDAAIEVELVGTGTGHYVAWARYVPARSDEYAKLLAAFQQAMKAPKRCAKDIEAMNEASRALDRFVEPRRVG